MQRFIYIHKETGKRILTDHELESEKFELVKEVYKTTDIKNTKKEEIKQT